MTEDAGEQADDGVDDDGGAEFAAGEDEVADAKLVVAKVFGDALVNAFVAAADQNDAFAAAEIAGNGLREATAAGGKQDDGLAGGVAGVFRGHA